jgi:hypothetical protein
MRVSEGYGRPGRPGSAARFSLALALAGLVVLLGPVESGATFGKVYWMNGPPLDAFKEWLTERHPGYGCDEGPGAFLNNTVAAAYPGRHFFYVLTYTRGIPIPFRNPLSLVAEVDEAGNVTPFRPSSPESYSRGLIPIRSSKDARLAAAAVSILTMCDPGERRWKYKPDLFKVKKKSGGWLATYSYGYSYASWVRFGRGGGVLEFGGSAPPVP